MNTKTSNNSLFYRTAAIFMIAMLLLAGMPVTPAFAATSVLVPWAKAYDQATGTGAGATRTIPAGSGRVLVVGIATTSAPAGTVGNPTVTYGGVTLTLATGNGATTGRMHTWLYYLKDNAVMDNTARPLNVTMGAGAILNMTVWSAVYAGVNQAPATYTTGNGFSNVTASGPAQLSAAMAVNAGEQAIYISNVHNAVNTTLPTYTINANWTTGGNNTGADAGASVAWRVEVANRTVPGANVTDTAATSALAPAFNERYAMSAMSLPAAVAPTVTTQAVTVIGTTTATGNGNITNLGVPNPTQYGVVWDTAINPTVALATKTTQGPIAVTGAFTSSITGLTSNTLYHVRAYATNSAGTSYGADVTFTTLPVAPTITSAAPANGTQGVAYSHTYTATGSTPMTFSLTAGAFPTGLTLTAGVLSGTPTATGTFTGTVTAANGTLPNATQNFSITINAASAITSANNTSFTLGLPGTFTVTATGFPAPTLSMTGALPAGVTFTPATGILAGTPAAGTGGSYPLTFTAANGVSPDAVQNFTLIVTDGPSFTSANNTTFSLGFPGTFTVTAVGTPAPTFSMVGSLPAGVTFTPATGILAGTPTVAGSFTLTFTATNGVVPDATQTFTLTVKNGPSVAPNGITSVPDTGDGSISNNESILDTLDISKLIVKFDQDVYDPAGNTDPKDVTNPANYMLVMRGPGGTFQTVSCLGGVQAPDVAIPITSVSYNSSTFTATVNISNPINVVGVYRLYVCGTTSIVDAANINLELAGDGANPGTDFLLNFRIQGLIAPSGNTNTDSSTSAKASLLPVTGFAPDKVTVLPAQPADKAYKSLGEIRIEIPSLGINYPIVGAMIDKNTWDLTWLKDSVAYLEGSAYPTLPGNTVLTAHVVDANNNLGPFSDIKGLQTGQKIYIHAYGQTYVYQVQDNQKIFATNISAAFKHEENSWITLVTCEDYNAKTELYSQRRMVRAVLISIISEK